MGSIMTVLASVGQILVPESLPSLHQGVDWLLVQMNGWFGSFAWTMIIFTILLKLVLFPLDYISRRSMKRNTMIQERMAPQLAKLEKQCKGDKTLYNQKMMLAMRKEGYKMAGACLPSIVTLVIFFYIFSALGSYTQHATAKIYKEMVIEYNQIVYDNNIGSHEEEVKIVDKDGNTVAKVDEDGNPVIRTVYEADAELMSSPEVMERLANRYKQVNPRWLWIKNTIRPDGFNTAIPTYDEAVSSGVGAPGIGDFIAGSSPENKRENYNRVMGITKDDEGNLAYLPGSIGEQYNTKGFKIFGKFLNGWFLLPLLAAGVSFLSQFLTQKMQGQAPGGTGQGAMKVMMVVFPVMMLFFAVSYTSGFSLYIITNSLCTLGISYGANWIAGKSLVKEFERKRLEKMKTSYRR